MAFFSVFLAVAIHVIDLRDPGRLLWTGARDRAKALRAPSLEASSYRNKCWKPTCGSAWYSIHSGNQRASSLSTVQPARL